MALVLGIAISWALIPLVQVCAGALLIVTARRRAVPLLEALDLFLMGHVPWSLWLLGAAAAIVLSPAPFPADRLLAASALVPLAWTAMIIAAFGRTVLLSTPRAAALRAAVHQLALWGGTSFFFIWLTDSWARVLALFSA